jgi:5-deoxy-5-amino-3-dehydroquinate dehydratase
MPDLLLLNGPNMRLLGRRQPEIYGTDTLLDIEQAVMVEISQAGWKLIARQADSEAELIRIIEDHYDCAGAVVNPAALMMNGWGLRDALANFPRPWIEVHISNIWARESFRHESVLSPLAAGVIAGLGPFGYVLAARALLERERRERLKRPEDRV